MSEVQGVDQVIAWTGELLLVEARWTDKDGHTVKFRIVQPDETKPNPFKQFTKQRSGKAGTRFHLAAAHVTENDESPVGVAYADEAMLAGWSDTNSGGHCVTFWLHPADGKTHPFEGFTRNVDAFMCGLVEVMDDEKPVDQEKRARVEVDIVPVKQEGGFAHCDECTTASQCFLGGKCLAPARLPQGAGYPFVPCDDCISGAHCIARRECSRRVATPQARKPQRLSMVAAMLCQNPNFIKWLGVETKDAAAHYMRAKLGIESRSALDIPANALAIQQFHAEFRIPFVEHMEQHEDYRRA